MLNKQKHKAQKMNLGFLASHGETNMQAIINACKLGILKASPTVVISNNSNSPALIRAKEENIPSYHLSTKNHPDKDALDTAICNTMRSHHVDLVILAGYMRKLGSQTLSHFSNRVLNIHPALLPKYGGKGMYGIHIHKAVIAVGEKESGVTIHIVNETYDTGPIVAQSRIPVAPEDTAESLAFRVLQREHTFFPEVLQKIVTGEIVLWKYKK